MRGRDMFRIAMPVFKVCEPALRLIPQRVADTGLQALRHVPTYVGLALLCFPAVTTRTSPDRAGNGLRARAS